MKFQNLVFYLLMHEKVLTRCVVKYLNSFAKAFNIFVKFCFSNDDSTIVEEVSEG